MNDEPCPVCEGSGAGPGFRFNPAGGCSWCDASGIVPADDVAGILETVAWLAARAAEREAESVR